MVKKSIWDVTALMGQTVVVTMENAPWIVGTIVEQDKDTITIYTPGNRSVIVAKSAITSLTQRAPTEI